MLYTILALFCHTILSVAYRQSSLPGSLSGALWVATMATSTVISTSISNDSPSYCEQRMPNMELPVLLPLIFGVLPLSSGLQMRRLTELSLQTDLTLLKTT